VSSYFRHFGSDDFSFWPVW